MCRPGNQPHRAAVWRNRTADPTRPSTRRGSPAVLAANRGPRRPTNCNVAPLLRARYYVKPGEKKAKGSIELHKASKIVCEESKLFIHCPGRVWELGAEHVGQVQEWGKVFLKVCARAWHAQHKWMIYA